MIVTISRGEIRPARARVPPPSTHERLGQPPSGIILNSTHSHHSHSLFVCPQVQMVLATLSPSAPVGPHTRL